MSQQFNCYLGFIKKYHRCINGWNEEYWEIMVLMFLVE